MFVLGIFSIAAVSFFITSFIKSVRNKKYLDLSISLFGALIMAVIAVFCIAESNFVFDTLVNRYISGEYYIEQVMTIIDSDTTSIIKYKLH